MCEQKYLRHLLKRKKPTWRNTLGCPRTSAYSLSSLPAPVHIGPAGLPYI